jgi:hypothetical protein
MPGCQLLLDRVLAVLQPVHRRVDLISGRARDAQVGPQRGVGPPGQGGQLGRRGDHLRDDLRQGQVAFPARRPEQRRQPQFHRHGVRGGDVAVRRRRGDRDRLPGGHQPLALQGGLDRGHRLGRQRRQVRQRLVPDLAAVPVSAADQHRLIHPPLPGLRHVRPPVPGYMHRAAACRHDQDHAGHLPASTGSTPHFVATFGSRSQDFQHLKTAMTTQSYNNSGLEGAHQAGETR